LLLPRAGPDLGPRRPGARAVRTIACRPYPALRITTSLSASISSASSRRVPAASSSTSGFARHRGERVAHSQLVVPRRGGREGVLALQFVR
jgi:hypothetical protein